MERLFGSVTNFNSHPQWVELYGLVLQFHIFRWNRAMLYNKFKILSEDDWERQGFKRRSDEIEKNKNRVQDFKQTVRLLNFFCDRCKRPGSVTAACDNTKCATLNILMSTTLDSKKAWSAAYNAWKLQRGAKEYKTQDCVAIHLGQFHNISWFTF
jgi:hypothetical protein